jgi:GNAT superfamily N-acetyltransferase
MTIDRKFSDDIEKPTFYGFESNGIIVGVNSVHRVDNTIRSRGLWVNPEFRKQGIGEKLLRYGIQIADEKMIWSYPREEAIRVYLNAGFEICSEKIIDLVDHKSNYYVKCQK